MVRMTERREGSMEGRSTGHWDVAQKVFPLGGGEGGYSRVALSNEGVPVVSF